MHPLITILRWWLWQVVAIMLAIYLPEAGLALFAGNCFGWWIGDGCCPSPTPVCGAACNSPLWSTISVTFTGYVAGSCDCTVLNATWSAPYFADFASNRGCYGIHEPFPCSDENGDGILRALVFTSSTTLNPAAHTAISVTWTCFAGSGSNIEGFLDNSTLDPSPIDCNSISSMSIPRNSDNSCFTNGFCDGRSSTCTVTITA